MRILLHSPVRKLVVLAIALLLAGCYLSLATTEYAAAYFSGKQDLPSLQRAVRLEPGNSNYHYLEGRYLWLVQRSPETAVQAYLAAVALNPHQARYWFDLAGAYDLLGDVDRQQKALEHAIQADPTTPEVAWEAANFYIVRGETDKALAEFRVVLQNDPYLPPDALQLCWRIKPDIDALLRDVVPPMSGVYSTFLEILTSRKETAAAAKVWSQMAKLHQPVTTRYVFDYIRYLVSERQVDQARVVWQQAGTLSGLASHQPTSENLVVNGDFSVDVLNGGFDWLYQQSPDASLALDPTQFHTGNRSLQIIFDSRGIEDAGIRQMIPVQPNTNYQFSAYFKTEDIQGVGGPRFAIQDLYSETLYFASDELKGADFWKPVTGNFITGPDCKLLMLRIQRFPAGSPIKGKLWIDGIRLAERQPQG
jgi:tetratricopeptide (TPR) repeat protein